jgi:hypothetical protein
VSLPLLQVTSHGDDAPEARRSGPPEQALPERALLEPAMSTLDFFDYLARSDATHELALRLIDIWGDRQLAALERTF